MWTRKSFVLRFAVLLLFAELLSGCESSNPFWKGKPIQTVQTPPTLPIVPGVGEYHLYDNSLAQHQGNQPCPHDGGTCGNHSGINGGACGGASCSGGCGGGCGKATGSAVATTGVPSAPQSQSSLPESQMAMQANSPAQNRYGGQKTCPVTGRALGTMGPAVPVNIAGQTIYVCCEGCVQTVQSDPGQYLAKAVQERGGA